MPFDSSPNSGQKPTIAGEHRLRKYVCLQCLAQLTSPMIIGTELGSILRVIGIPCSMRSCETLYRSEQNRQRKNLENKYMYHDQDIYRSKSVVYRSCESLARVANN